MPEAAAPARKYPSKGAFELEKVVKAGVTQADVARATGVGPDEVSRWLSLDRRPSLKSALALQREYGIEMSLWHEDPGAEPEEAPPESGPADEQKEAAG